MSSQPFPGSGVVPRGSEVDHINPDEFLVRCTACGRIGRKDGRGRAHRLADNHALRCSQTGVTPVSSTDTAATADAAETTVADGGLEVTQADLRGEGIVVEYDSVSERATRQRIAGDVVAMLPAPEDRDDVEHSGVVLRLSDGRRRLVDVLQDRVKCSTNGGRDIQWRTIGYLERLASPDEPDRSPRFEGALRRDA
ncbi:hypothetical protein BRD02_01610 [Halobacteriales archaeon QS_8_69_73]|nr:MAG: hypothetical protein BRD02_01610 [Halobacteriales archaeon QS_8_69_73]